MSSRYIAYFRLCGREQGYPLSFFFLIYIIGAMITAIRKRKPVFDSSQSVISEAMGLFIFFPFQCGLFPYLGLALSDVTLVIDTISSKELEENYGVGFLVLQGFAISTSAIRARFYFSIVNRRVTRFVDGLGIHCPPLVSPFFDCTCF